MQLVVLFFFFSFIFFFYFLKLIDLFGCLDLSCGTWGLRWIISMWHINSSCASLVVPLGLSNCGTRGSRVHGSVVTARSMCDQGPNS